MMQSDFDDNILPAADVAPTQPMMSMPEMLNDGMPIPDMLMPDMHEVQMPCMPMQNMPMQNMPMNNMPMNSMPMNSMPMCTMPAQNMPVPCMPMPKLAHAYVPFQCLNCIYPPMKGLDAGTIFPELDRPYGTDPEYTVDA